MKECICIFLRREDGTGRGKTIPATPPKHAKAECLANCEEDCPKSRAKFRFTEWCFRIKTKQKVTGKTESV